MEYKKQQAIHKKRRERIKALFFAGMSAIKIAAKEGVTRNRVYQILAQK